MLDKKSLHIISAESNGSKLRNLRLRNNLAIKELAKEINISDTTLRHIELDKIQIPYYYLKLICDYFNVDHVAYLQLYTLKEISIQDKLIKIRALLGAKTWKGVGEYLGYSESFINDLYTRYTPNAHHLELIDKALEKLK